MRTVNGIKTLLETRKTGKTSLLKAGIDNYPKPFYLLARNRNYAKGITENRNCIVITPQTIEKTFGSRIPIIIDQESIKDMLDDFIKTEKYSFELSKKATLLHIENKELKQRKMDLEKRLEETLNALSQITKIVENI